MDLDPVFLSRIQFAFVVSFHIISLSFLFVGGIVVFPVIVAYTLGVYWVFRGKVRVGYG